MLVVVLRMSSSCDTGLGRVAWVGTGVAVIVFAHSAAAAVCNWPAPHGERRPRHSWLTSSTLRKNMEMSAFFVANHLSERALKRITLLAMTPVGHCFAVRT